MCLTTNVVCWHCGNWIKKDNGQLDFVQCPSCGKGFDDLTPEQQIVVQRTLKPFEQYKIPEKVQLLETILDSLHQKHQDNNIGKALGAARSLQRLFPQPNYSLYHFNDPKKVQGHDMYKNWKRYKREKAMEKIKPLAIEK